jgi:hypothetical protein
MKALRRKGGRVYVFCLMAFTFENGFENFVALYCKFAV